MDNIKNLVETFLKKNGLYNSPVEWVSDNCFIDDYGCDGYIFNDRDEAKESILHGENHQNAIDSVDGACTDEDWVNMLINADIHPNEAREIIKNNNWEKVIEIIVDISGPEWFLATYSGNSYELPNGMILYY